jgi:hypothetical protein
VPLCITPYGTRYDKIRDPVRYSMLQLYLKENFPPRTISYSKLYLTVPHYIVNVRYCMGLCLVLCAIARQYGIFKNILWYTVRQSTVRLYYMIHSTSLYRTLCVTYTSMVNCTIWRTVHHFTAQYCILYNVRHNMV